MRKWQKRIVFSAALLLLVLSSVWAWPSQLYGKSKGSQAQEPPASVKLEAGGAMNGPAPHSTMQQTTSDEELRIAGKSSGEQLGEASAGETDLLEAQLDIIDASAQTMVDEYNELMSERDRLADENGELSEDLAEAYGRSDWHALLIPEAAYDIGSNTWGIGLSMGASWRNLLVMAGIEKEINKDFFTDPEGLQVRFGVGIIL